VTHADDILASTPPGSGSQIQYPSTQAYDTRQMYAAPASSYGQYGNSQQYSQVQPSPSVKNEMAPPARAGAENEHADHKSHDGYAGGHHDAEGEHESEYTHQNGAYGSRKASYSGNPTPSSGTIHSDSSHISPEMTHSPHQNGSGRATPRSAAPYANYTGAPQRAAQLPSSNLYTVMSNDARAGATNGTEPYANQGYPAQQYPSMNGVSQNNKRGRDSDAEEDPYNGGLKRARTEGGPVGARPIAQPKGIR
jgi:protein SOK2